MVTFHVDSDPSGATLMVGGKVIGTTPAVFVALGGWLLLLLVPAVIILVAR